MDELHGIAVSDGVGFGRVRMPRQVLTSLNPAASVKDELLQWKCGLSVAQDEIQQLCDEATDDLQREVMETHLMLLEDPELIDPIIDLIHQGVSAYDAAKQTSDAIAAKFEQLDDEYLRARAVDIRDIGHRLCTNLADESGDEEIGANCVLVTDELYPSQVLALKKVAGVITAKGGSNSHAAILIRAAGIPAVFGVADILQSTNEDEMIIVNGYDGTVTIQPTKRNIGSALIDTENNRSDARSALVRHGIGDLNIKANIGSIEDAKQAISAGCDGFGIVRTEFLFQDRSTAPTEDEQYECYAELVSIAKGLPVVLRTLDAGSDKPLAYIQHPNEANPALGLRGIRLSLAQPDLFTTQLRAMIRAAALGPVTILLPMVSRLSELNTALDMAKDTIIQMSTQGHPVSNVKIGAMIETPAAAIHASQIAHDVDYLSIGTNDLTQYTLAVDRTNGSVGHLYDELDESVLQLIKITVDAARAKGKPVCVCGEMAARTAALLELLKMGVREISVSPVFIARIRDLA
ncbi:MAG: phosphoenolpyruvate--protein phosphotransferase [Armatimonadota bacterium]